MADETLGRIHEYFAACPAERDCASCRHYVSLVMHYVYGKPPQHHEIQPYNARAQTERLAEELGLSPDETRAALAEVERLLRQA